MNFLFSVPTCFQTFSTEMSDFNKKPVVSTSYEKKDHNIQYYYEFKKSVLNNN